MRRLRDPLLWLVLFYGALLTLMPYSGPLFHRWFPELARPLYQQESFWQLTLAHLFLVITASLLAIVIGIGSGVLVTRRAGRADDSAGGSAGDCGAGDGIWRLARSRGAAALRIAADFTGDAGGY